MIDAPFLSINFSVEIVTETTVIPPMSSAEPRRPAGRCQNDVGQDTEEQ
jgi:hypothetical protein